MRFFFGLVLALAVCAFAADPELDERFAFQIDGAPATCYRIAFERYPNNPAGTSFSSFNVFDTVTNQYAPWGLTFSLEKLCNGIPFSSPDCQASISRGYVIFNSSAPSTADPDLNTPNENCPGGGPGHAGDAQSAINAAANTCTTLGKIPIIQNPTHHNFPDDSILGGSVVLTFSRPMTVRAMGILDIEVSEALRGADVLWYAGTGPSYVPIGGYNITGVLGDNVYNVFRIPSPPIVTRVKVDFPSSGSLTDLVYCENEGDVPCGTFGGNDCCEENRYCSHQEAHNPTGKTVCLDPEEFISQELC